MIDCKGWPLVVGNPVFIRGNPFEAGLSRIGYVESFNGEGKPLVCFFDRPHRLSFEGDQLDRIA